MATIQQPTIRQTFEKLPTKIREWLTSEEATYIIIELNRRLGLEGILIEVVPNTITRLVTKDLNPQNFVDDLSNGLDVDWPTARGVAEEIERRILRPVEVPLRNEVGIDIKAIFLAKPPASPIISSATPIRPTIQTNNPASPTMPPAPPIYRPASQIPTPPPIPPKPATPPAPTEIPVKINVQPVRPAQGENPPGRQPFGADSWVNKVK